MKVITYRIKLKEPVLVKGLEGDPNSGVSYLFLPGSVLRGALIGLYLRGKSADNLLQDEVARRLFFDPDKTRFLNGYLLRRHNDAAYRALPTPLSWHYRKLEKRSSRIDCDTNSDAQPTQFDHAVQSVKVEDVSPEGEKDSWQQQKTSFCLSLPGQFALTNVQRRVSVHTARHRDYGRARAESGEADDIFSGAVYRYEAIEAGQTFEAHILCQTDDVTTLTNLVKGEILLGGARSAGYGRVALELHPPIKPDDDRYQAQELDKWQEATPVGSDFDGVVVTLLSDTLLRDEHGQSQATVTELTRRLGFAETDRRSAFVAYRPVGGFNRKWGLPTIQQTGLKMGSVLVFKAPSKEQMVRLRQLEKSGIGEQREDGFGRLAVNWHTIASFKPAAIQSPKTREIALSGTASEPAAQIIVNRLQQNHLEGRIREQAMRLAKNAKMEMVSKTQLNRLRLKLQTAVHELTNKGEEAVAAQRAILQDYKDSLEKRNQTRRQFERARLGRRPFLQWLQERLDAKTLPVESGKVYALGKVEAQTDEETTRLASNLRLAHLTLAHVVKARRTVPANKEEQK
jgi:CRISPR-associated protein Csx10